MLNDFCYKKYSNKAEFARAFELAVPQDLQYWIEKGAVPGWALLNLLRKEPEARDFFLGGITTTQVMETPSSYETDKITKQASKPESSVISDQRKELENALRRTEEVLDQLRAKAKAMVSDLTDENALVNTVVSDKAPLGARPVEIYDLNIAAGGGALVDTEARGESMWFRRDWLDRHGLDPTQCSVFNVRGESMEETLPDGCSILVDRNQTRRRVGHIYAVRTEDGLIVKRLRKDEDGDWLLVSDHPRWKPLRWPDTAEVIGQVKWMAKTL